jgi:hypothetical protein
VITARHFEYKNPPEADHNWNESFVFPVVVPEAHLYALVYTNVRPALGVMANQVMISGSLADTRSQLLHYNDNQHLPAPERLSRLTSPFGLDISVVDAPRDFRIDYVGYGDTEIHVDWRGLMDPFDIHDPDHSPQAGKVKDVHHEVDPRTATGPRPYGHLDMTGRVTGTLTVKGREFEVDSIERMDHSWGPRNPMNLKSMYIVSATFGPDLAFHMICPWDPAKSGAEAFELTHGYVVEDGEVFGLTSELEMTSVNLGLVCVAIDMTVTDVRGKRFRLRGSADVGAPWYPYPSVVSYNALMSWSLGDRTGYGVVMPNHSIPALIHERGRFHDDPLSTIGC